MLGDEIGVRLLRTINLRYIERAGNRRCCCSKARSEIRPVFETMKFRDWGGPWLLSQPRVTFSDEEGESQVTEEQCV